MKTEEKNEKTHKGKYVTYIVKNDIVVYCNIHFLERRAANANHESF